MATLWLPVVTLDGVDVSASITGQIQVEAEEATSRISSFIMRPDSGTISAGDWLGVAATIDFKTVTSAGATIAQTRIFTGTVDQAVYDPSTRLTSFDCTDEMQGQFEAKTQAQIDAIMLNSRWSEAAFGEYEDGWLYFENLSKTYPQSYDYNVDGVTGTLVDWAAKVTPDFSYVSASMIDGTVRYSIAPRRQLFNEFTLNYSYRFDRLKHREHDFSWSDIAFCGYLAQSHTLPTREMIVGAATGAGWTVKLPILFGSLLPTATDPCNTGANWIISEEFREQLAISASWQATKRWTQSATENYVLTITAPQSVAWLGAIAYEEQASNQTDTDSNGWADDSATPTGRTDSLGDIVQDKYDRAISDNDIETLIARARTEILSAHRENFVEAEIELNPSLERFHTVRLDDNGIIGQGKVFKYTHTLDHDEGSAITAIKIAVSLNGGGAAAGDSAIAAPTGPNTDPVIAAPTNSTTLTSRIGSDDTVPVYDSAWDGFTGNYSVIVGTPTAAQIYPRQFKVSTADIDQEAIDHIEAEKTQAYSFDIPDETLTITVT